MRKSGYYRIVHFNQVIVMKKTIKLIPPKVSFTTVSQMLCCDRPQREGNFNISLERKGKKLIVHCYGHGSSGWTALFGSVKRALELFQRAAVAFDAPICVIGSGCMGLTVAIELASLGYLHVKIVTKELYDLPSWKAAGMFALFTVEATAEERAIIHQINLHSFLSYKLIEEGKHPYLTRQAVKLIPYYCRADLESGIEQLESDGLMPPKEEVDLDFGNGVFHKGFMKYMTYFMDTTSLMQQLTAHVKRLNIPIVLEQIDEFSGVSEEIIFNCAGLGAKELNADSKLTPVRGFLATLNSHAGADHLSYMLATTVIQEGKEETIYLIPKTLSVTPDNPSGIACHGALGGTFIPLTQCLSAQEEKILKELECKRLIERGAQFFNGTV